VPVTITCPCGESRTVPDNFAGRTVLCSRCGEAAVVPEPRSQPAGDGASPAPTTKPWQKETAAEPAHESAPQPVNKSGIGGEVLGGALAMVIAVIWFVAGLAADRFFIYPPFLFIGGLIAVVKGLVQKSR
jgi:hypothetical protein